MLRRSTLLRRSSVTTPRESQSFGVFSFWGFSWRLVVPVLPVFPECCCVWLCGRVCVWGGRGVRHSSVSSGLTVCACVGPAVASCWAFFRGFLFRFLSQDTLGGTSRVAEPLRSSSDGARSDFRGLATLWSESYSPRSTYDYVWYVAFMARCSFYSISSRSSSAVTPYVGTMAVFKTFPENVQSAAPQLEPTLEAALRKYEVHEDISTGFRCKRMKSLAVFVALDRTVEGRRIRSKKRLV